MRPISIISLLSLIGLVSLGLFISLHGGHAAECPPLFFGFSNCASIASPTYAANHLKTLSGFTNAPVIGIVLFLVSLLAISITKHLNGQISYPKYYPRKKFLKFSTQNSSLAQRPFLNWLRILENSPSF